MNIRPVQPFDAAEWLRLRMALWPESSPDKEASEIALFFSMPPLPPLPALHAAFVCERPEGGLCGMAEASLRSYADGCESAPAAYLEGWYVDSDVRGRGIGRALVVAVEGWARAQGCRELASDASPDNIISQAAHARLGFRETGRAVQFCKWLDAETPADDLATAIDELMMRDQFFADYLERLEGLQRRLHTDVQDLPTEAMDWSPGPNMNSVAVLLAHMTGVLREGIDIALAIPNNRVRVQEFLTHGVLLSEMLGHLDAVIDYARDALPRLSLADLDKERQDEDGPVTCGWALLHALEHAYLHLGHIQITCQLWRQREK